MPSNVCLLYFFKYNIMHFLNSFFKVVYVNLQNVELKFLALLYKMRLNRLVLANLFINISLNVFRQILIKNEMKRVCLTFSFF